MADQTVMDKVLAQLHAQEIANMPANAAEKFFDAIGLMRGPMSPVYRGAFGFLAASALLFAVRPGFAFNGDGSPRQWAAMSPRDDATPVPFWVAGLLVGAYCGLFI
jgi:hypothetical protein